MKEITVGIPAYKAHNFIVRCLASIQIQSIIDKLQIVIANDLPGDNYDYLKEIFPELDLIILECKENTGAGLARQRIIDTCKTPWITFIDADDVFYSPYSLQSLYNQATDNIAVIQGGILEERLTGGSIFHTEPFMQTWVFAKLYNVEFLRQNNIRFSGLRAAEDTEFEQILNLITWGLQEKRKFIEDIIIIWKCNGSSITRSYLNNEVPQYTFDLAIIGFVQATLNAVDFCINKIDMKLIAQFAVETMIYLYAMCIKCKEKAPIFYEQTIFNAKRFYNECLIKYPIENVENLFGAYCDPEDTRFNIESFYEFLNYIKQQPYGGIEELYTIRKSLPIELLNNSRISGVLGKDDLI